MCIDTYIDSYTYVGGEAPLLIVCKLLLFWVKLELDHFKNLFPGWQKIQVRVPAEPRTEPSGHPHLIIPLDWDHGSEARLRKPDHPDLSYQSFEEFYQNQQVEKIKVELGLV